MNETTDAATIFAPLWRRKWLILAVGVLVAVATYAYYKHRPAVYSATTQLNLVGGSEAQQLLTGTQSKTTLDSRELTDVATLITSSAATEAVQARLRKEHVKAKSHGKVRAKAASESDFVTITAEAGTARGAVHLANAYALVYLEQQHVDHRREVRAAILDTRRQLRRIETAQAASVNASKAKHSGKSSASHTATSGVSGSAVIQSASLASKINQLESELLVSSVQQINTAKPKSAQLVSPKPKANAIFGFALGVLLAAIAVLMLSRLDRRIRTLGQVEAIFETQILTVLPRVRTPVLRGSEGSRPAEPLIEPLRRLHTSLQLGDMLEHDRELSPSLILFLSADAGDGKSTLVADLALIQRDAGARVAVIEADLRRPVQAGLLSVGASSGLEGVLTGASTLDEAMQPVGSTLPAADIDSMQSVGRVSTVARSRSSGSLSLLAGGGEVANPPALLASPAMQELLRVAAADFDYVLIDAPPPLRVSDVMPLLHAVDGIVIVARMEHTREASAERLTQLLARSSTAPVLGVVANSVSRAEIRRCGFSSAYGERRWPGKLISS
jgi:Mrp family chromosome partitioning ATPase